MHKDDGNMLRKFHVNQIYHFKYTFQKFSTIGENKAATRANIVLYEATEHGKGRKI